LRGLDIDPVHPETYAFLAALTLRTGDSVEAGRLRDTSLIRFRKSRLSPADCQSTLGEAFLLAGCLAEAIGYYREAIALERNQAGAHAGLGHAFREAGMPADAMLECETALRLDSTLADAHVQIAMLLQTMGDAAGARLHYTMFLHLHPAGLVADSIRQRLLAPGP
jgi:tetratricopeptide (TPR) repeat protein